MPKLAGALVLENRRLLIERLGRESYERALASLTPGARSEYLNVTSVSWIDVHVAWAVIETMATQAGLDPYAVYEDIARSTVENTLRTIWRLLLRFTSDEALVSRTPRIYARAYDAGELISTITAPGVAEVKVIGWPDMPEFSLRGIQTAIETTLRVAGRENVRVTTTGRTREGPTFRATWHV